MKRAGQTAMLHHFPWLGRLPPGIYDRLDWSEFAVPTVELDRVRAEAEARTGHLIMTYRTGHTPDHPGPIRCAP